MKRLLALALCLVPAVALAQPAPEPSAIALPAATVSHAIAYLRGGGTYAEAQALAGQMLQEAQADVARQQAAAAKAAAKPTATPAP